MTFLLQCSNISKSATCVYRKLDFAILVVKATENWV
jgi:hypothetical protein